MKHKKCYIVGSMPAKLNFTPDEEDLVVAADRGYLTLREQGVPYDVIIGDFDSSEKPEGDNIIALDPIKDDTDTVAAVKYALGKGCDRFYLYGIMGGRPDMTVASLQTLTYILGEGAKGVIVDDGYAVMAIRNDRIDFKSSAKGVFSVFSFDEISKGVSITGAKYPLSDTVLTNSYPLGVSNEFSDERSSVSVCDGTLHVFFPCSHPDEVLYQW